MKQGPFATLLSDRIPPMADTDSELIDTIFAEARNRFLEDGFHTHLAWLFRNRRPTALLNMTHENDREKQAKYHALAELASSTRSNAAITLLECWIATTSPGAPPCRPSQAPDRTEHLLLVHASVEAPPKFLTAQIRRKEDDVFLDAPVPFHTAVPFLLAPLYEVWGIPLPNADLPGLDTPDPAAPSAPPSTARH